MDRIADPQREALETTFGLREGPVPDRFLAGLGMLSLFSEAAQERPLVWAVDDAQWLDRASAQVLAFSLGFRSWWWFGLPGTLLLSGKNEQSLATRLEALPQDTQQLLLVAAAEPTGDPAIVWSAAQRLESQTRPSGPDSRSSPAERSSGSSRRPAPRTSSTASGCGVSVADGRPGSSCAPRFRS